jgi:predicted nucleic acid-binding protein
MEEMLAEAVLGRDAEEFVASELGQTMIGMAQQEIDEATYKLQRTSPWRTRRIRELQNEIWRAQSFQAWLVELAERGQQAKQQLEI